MCDTHNNREQLPLQGSYYLTWGKYLEPTTHPQVVIEVEQAYGLDGVHHGVVTSRVSAPMQQHLGHLVLAEHRPGLKLRVPHAVQAGQVCRITQGCRCAHRILLISTKASHNGQEEMRW